MRTNKRYGKLRKIKAASGRWLEQVSGAPFANTGGIKKS
jgi:hypothetical protein